MAEFKRSRGPGGRDSGDRPTRSYGGRDSDRPARSFGGRDSNRGGYGGERRDSGRGDFRSSGRSDDRGFGRDRAPKEMTMVTCDACKKKCEVPFRPTSDKPVYCSDCFRNNSESSPRGNSSKGIDLTEINQKLDKILKLLEKKE